MNESGCGNEGTEGLLKGARRAPVLALESEHAASQI
jgi:hypothetical protein